MNIYEGDPLEIFVDHEKGIVCLKKYRFRKNEDEYTEEEDE